MKKYLMNLQRFAEGGAPGAGAATGSEVGAVDGTGKGSTANPLANVIYGKQNDGLAADPTVADTEATKDKSRMFEEMIKGEYKDEFHSRTQAIIDQRFKDHKSLQSKVKSYDPIMSILGQKYGIDATDTKALQKALEEDDAFFEEEAIRKGVSVEQLREVKKLQREVETLHHAQAEEERRAEGERIYNGWLQEAEALKAKYGLENFDLEAEVQNPEFVSLLQNPNITMESAYKAIHMDEMMGGAMAKTATAVRQQMADSIASGASRPSENGISPKSSQVFKTDVASLTKEDVAEVIRRAARGETISF